MLIQLCIIFPAEPGTLLEHLPRVTRGPLLLAVSSSVAANEPLLKIGLEYLDGWIDHLGVPALAACVGPPTLSELGAKLAAHLKPLPNFGDKAGNMMIMRRFYSV